MSGSGNYNHFGDEEGNLVRNDVVKYRQFQAAIIAGLAGTAAGTGEGWLLTSILNHDPSFVNVHNMKTLSAVMNFAGLVGAITSCFLLDKIGRKKTLIFGGLLMMPTWILYMISHKIFITLTIGTAIAGFASGILSAAIPVYIAEISEPSIRGTLGMFFYLQYISGEFFTTFDEDIYLNDVAVNCILVTTVFLMIFVWMPETPYSLVLKGEENEAKMSVTFYQGTNQYVEEEIENIKVSISKRKSIKEILKDDNVVNAFIVSLLSMFLCRLVAMDGFYLRIYKLETRIQHYDITTIFLLIQIIGLLCAAYFVERIGRRLMLIVSASIMMTILIFSITMIVLGLFLRLIPDKIVNYSVLILGPIYLAGFSFGVAPLPWVLMNELVPHQYRVLSSTLSTSIFWIMSLTFSIRTNFIIDMITEIGAMICIFILSVLIVIYAVYMLPETKGRNPNTIVVPDVITFFKRNST